MSFSALSEPVILEDEVALLRPLELSDAEHLMRFALEQPELFRYNSIPAAGKENMENYVALAVSGLRTGAEYPFVVIDKRSGQYAGSTRFYDLQPDQKTLQLGYTWYGKEFQGTGLNKHCKFLLMQFAFETLDAERLEFRADNDNQRSIAAMKSIGCTVEGILRSQRFRLDGTRRDTIVLSVLRDEWFGRIKNELKAKL